MILWHNLLTCTCTALYVILCFVLAMKYIRGSGAPECIFQNQYKHIVSYLAFIQLFTLIAYLEIHVYNMIYISLNSLSITSLLAIDAFRWDFDRSIFVIIFCNII